MIADDSLLIFYQDLKNDAERKVYEEMQKFYYLLKGKGYAETLKVLFYPSHDFPGYSYIKIYNKNANRQNMLDYLKTMTGLEETVTFGSIEGKYDVTVKEGEADKVAKTLKRMYMQPLCSAKRLRFSKTEL